MADTSPGKVQALKAMFSQKDGPVMGLLPCNGKLGTRPWKSSLSSLNEDNPLQEQVKNVRVPTSNAASSAILKSLQSANVHKKNLTRTYDSDIKCDKNYTKPAVGPKPVFLKQPCRTNLNDPHRPYENSLFKTQTQNNINGTSRKTYDTIASFMFADGMSKNNSITTDPQTLNSTGEVDSNIKKDMGFCPPLSLINSDNYICKGSYSLVKNELPPNHKAASAPSKPPRPAHVKLPARFLTGNTTVSQENHQQIMPVRTAPIRPDVLHLRNTNIPQKPPYPCPPRPTSSPPLPPSSDSFDNTKRNSKNKSLLEEIDELYEDTVLKDNLHRPVSLIPEYSAEEEEAELYDDANHIDCVSNNVTCFMKPKHPPPPPPSEYLNPVTEELYQDAVEPITDEVYEEMPSYIQDEDPYSNNKKEIERLKRDEEKRMKKEVKEREKKEKEFDKIKKKFGLTGEELPIDTGLVKTDNRGGRSDLPVKRGDIVYILRIESNPAGKWLVRNKKGKYGFVELTNIEVDPDSVKSVMRTRRTSVISCSEELYSEAYSDEAIYESTY